MFRNGLFDNHFKRTSAIGITTGKPTPAQAGSEDFNGIFRERRRSAPSASVAPGRCVVVVPAIDTERARDVDGFRRRADDSAEAVKGLFGKMAGGGG